VVLGGIDVGIWLRLIQLLQSGWLPKKHNRLSQALLMMISLQHERRFFGLSVSKRV
jgi:hypothetical protein